MKHKFKKAYKISIADDKITYKAAHAKRTCEKRKAAIPEVFIVGIFFLVVPKMIVSNT